jgi:hypothetical protein
VHVHADWAASAKERTSEGSSLLSATCTHVYDAVRF